MESLIRASEKNGHHAARVSTTVCHQMLTFLTAKGLYDAQIQLISWHETKK